MECLAEVTAGRKGLGKEGDFEQGKRKMMGRGSRERTGGWRAERVPATRIPPASVSTSTRPLNMALSMVSCPVRVRSVV